MRITMGFPHSGHMTSVGTGLGLGGSGGRSTFMSLGMRRMPLHSGYPVQVKNGPKRPRRISMGRPQISQTMSGGAGIAVEPEDARAAWAVLAALGREADVLSAPASPPLWSALLSFSAATSLGRGLMRPSGPIATSSVSLQSGYAEQERKGPRLPRAEFHGFAANRAIHLVRHSEFFRGLGLFHRARLCNRGYSCSPDSWSTPGMDPFCFV